MSKRMEFEEVNSDEMVNPNNKYSFVSASLDNMFNAYSEVSVTESVNHISKGKMEDEVIKGDDSITQPVQQAVCDEDIGCTVPVDDYEMINNDIDRKTKPTVGWLICTEGAYKGKDFSLRDGWNIVGCSRNADVNILDSKIREKRLIRIAYVSREHTFSVTPCEDASNIVYHNDQPILGPQKLNAYDKITFGSTTMIFVPLCTDKFSWEE